MFDLAPTEALVPEDDRRDLFGDLLLSGLGDRPQPDVLARTFPTSVVERSRGSALVAGPLARWGGGRGRAASIACSRGWRGLPSSGGDWP